MQNFGTIKNAFNNILSENIVSKNGENKKLFKKYIKTIKENEILKTQFLVFNNIENKVEENEFKAAQFVHENIELIRKYPKKDIVEALATLAASIMFEKIGLYPTELETLHENIANLIMLERNPKNVDAIVEATANVVNYIRTNKKPELTEATGVPNSLLSSISVEKFNDRYSEISESDKKILKAIIDGDSESKKNLKEEVIRECIDLVNGKLTESSLNVEVKDKLLSVKDRLLNEKGQFDEDTYITSISKLIELKNNLTTQN